MSLHTGAQDEMPLSVAWGLLTVCGSAVLWLGSRSHPALSGWAWGISALAVFSLIFMIPGWAVTIWYGLVRKSPEAEIERKRHRVNVISGWTAAITLGAVVFLVVSPPDTWTWSWRDFWIVVVCVLGLIGVGMVLDQITETQLRVRRIEEKLDILMGHRQ